MNAFVKREASIEASLDFYLFSDCQAELMLEGGEDLGAYLIRFLDGERSVTCTECYAEGHGFLALAELCATVDVEELDVLDELAACSRDESGELAYLKCLVADE